MGAGQLDRYIYKMHNEYMHNINGKCNMSLSKPRHRVTLALDGDLWDKFQPILKHKWEGSFTSWMEYAMECYTRDTCEGCPYEPEDDKREKSPDGIGKVIED